MKTEIFTLCDYATAEPMSGKMNVLGSFDHINSAQVPVIWPLCAIAIKVRIDEEGTKGFQVNVIDSDGRIVVAPPPMQIPIRLPVGFSTATVQFVLTMPQLKLPNFGEYAIDLRADGVSVATIPLYVRQIQVPAQPI